MILSFRTENGGFGLTDNETPEIDITAICLQALAPYQENEIVKEATDKAIEYFQRVDLVSNPVVGRYLADIYQYQSDVKLRKKELFTNSF